MISADEDVNYFTMSTYHISSLYRFSILYSTVF